MFLCIASSSFGDEGAEKPTKEKLEILYKSYLTARKCLHSCQLCQANVMPTFHGQKENLKCGNRSTETEVRKPKYGNQSTEVRRKAAYQCLVPY